MSNAVYDLRDREAERSLGAVHSVEAGGVVAREPERRSQTDVVRMPADAIRHSMVESGVQPSKPHAH